MSKVELEEKWLSERIFELKYILYGPVEYDFEKAEDEVQRLKKNYGDVNGAARQN